MTRQPGERRTWLRSLLALAVLAALGGTLHAGVRIDLAPSAGRNDGRSREIENWGVPNGAKAQARFGDVQVTLRATNGALLEGVLWKAGYATNALIASDGITLVGGNANSRMEIVLSGLKPGKHSLTSYHNVLSERASNSYSVTAEGGRPVPVRPTARIASDHDLATAHVEFEVRPGQNQAIVSIGGANLILNGLAIDLSDPKKSAGVLIPEAGDEHASKDGRLQWRAPEGVKSYNVYLGTDETAVAGATSQSPQFVGTVNSAQFAPKNLDHMPTYFWRVDSVAADGTVTRGDVWRFRVAHLAFPGAEGYGRFARGGRGGRVIEVTNLNDSGPGSLRAAVEAEGPRTVVFRVGGTIHLKSRLIVSNPYCTIAGQTAPGEGIATRGYTFATGGTHDVIIRYMRIRIGDESGVTQDGSGMGSADHSIMDHCSVAWSIDEGFSARGAKNITLQRSIITEPLHMSIHDHYIGSGKGHGFAGSISGNISSFHHNLLANCAGRNWSLAGALSQANLFAGYLDIRNNVCYNWHHRTTDGGARKVNFVGNYYIPGPATRDDVNHFVLAQLEMKLPNDIQQYYVADNVMEGYPQYTADNVRGGGLKFQHTTPDDERRMVLAEPFCEPHITVHSAKEAYESVLSDVGPNIPKLDIIDARAVETTKNRSFKFKGSKTGLPGIPDSQADTGPYPDLQGGEAPADADHDGMPDWFEIKHGLNPNDPSDGNGDRNSDGWTNLEEYLNWIVENGSLTPK